MRAQHIAAQMKDSRKQVNCDKHENSFFVDNISLCALLSAHAHTYVRECERVFDLEAAAQNKHVDNGGRVSFYLEARIDTSFE